MMTLTRTVAALLVAGPVALALPAAAQEEAGDASGPRFIQLDPTAPSAEERGGDVKVIRGSAVRLEPVERNVASKAVPQDGIEVVGGDQLWLVDRKAGVVTGCFLAATIRAGAVGEVLCTTERLP